MTQPQFRNQMSYREQFLSRYKSEKRRTSLHDTKKSVQPSILNPRSSDGTVLEKGCRTKETKVRSPTASIMNAQHRHAVEMIRNHPIQPNTTAESQERGESKLEKQIVKEGNNQDPKDGYHEMLDLTSDMERQCLSLGENNPQENVGPSEHDHQNGNSIVQEQHVTTTKLSSNNDDQDASSTWINLVDQLSLKKWFSALTGNASDVENNEDGGYELLSDYECNNFASDTELAKNQPNPYELILALIDEICEGDHSSSSVINCFKCQYKDSFKSFTLKHMDKLDEILRSKALSREEQDEVFKATLEMWIYQLCEQNLSLAVAYDESTQASEKLKTVLLQSRNAMRALQKENDKDKASIDALNYELSLRDKSIKKMKYELEMQSEQMKVMEDTLQDTQADVKSLTELIIRLRDKGVWDINGLPMGDDTFNKIFNGDYYLHGAKVIGHKEYSAKKREWRHEIEQLKSEGETLRAIIAAKDKEIQKFKSSESGSGRC